MAKVYFVRHQAAGTLFEFPFARTPSDAQLEALRLRCFAIHGACHPKTPGEPYWLSVVSYDVLSPSDVPEVPPPNLTVPGVANEAEANVNTVSGTGKVE